jgi:cholesterol oxidase
MKLDGASIFELLDAFKVTCTAAVPTVWLALLTHLEATGGTLQEPLPGSFLKNMVTLHPLGGCRIGATPQTGVVNHLGQVFGYPNLYVVDGSIAPTATGRNPSHTIAAMAERIAAHVN